jgi:hypothetical protein
MMDFLFILKQGKSFLAMKSASSQSHFFHDAIITKHQTITTLFERVTLPVEVLQTSFRHKNFDSIRKLLIVERCQESVFLHEFLIHFATLILPSQR